MAFPPVIGVRKHYPPVRSDRRSARMVPEYVALSKVTEIVASNPGDIEKRSPFFTVYVLPL